MKQYDVIVVGGGPGGIAAAWGSAKFGAKVLIVEKCGYLGGAATNMSVYPFMTIWAGSEQVIHGAFQELVDEMSRRTGGKQELPIRFSPEVLKKASEDMLTLAGVDILFHSSVVGASASGGTVSGITVANKAGLSELHAPVFVDATGDADLSAYAGAQVEFGRSSDGLCQPMTLNFRMAGIDTAAMPSATRITELYLEAKAEGRVRCPREDVLWFSTPEPGVVHFNTTRVIAKSAIDPWALSEAEVEGRRQMWDVVGFLQAEIRGFEGSYLQSSGAQIGVRESRRVMGDYVLTDDDLVATVKFPDRIANGSYNVDIHNPSGSGTSFRYIPDGDWYTIPYRCLTPRGLNNLLVAGRPISCTHEAHSAIRIMPIAYAIGHAAGVAAAMAATAPCTTRGIDVDALRSELNRQGAKLA